MDINILKFVPYLIPILIIQLVLIVIALLDLIHREKTKGPKWVWILIIIFINYIGPILYFVIGKEEE
jgi:hypothetical protein